PLAEYGMQASRAAPGRNAQLRLICHTCDIFQACRRNSLTPILTNSRASVQPVRLWASRLGWFDTLSPKESLARSEVQVLEATDTTRHRSSTSVAPPHKLWMLAIPRPLFVHSASSPSAASQARGRLATRSLGSSCSHSLEPWSWRGAQMS